MSTYEAEFIWPYPAYTVILKGSFDNWTSSVRLTKTGTVFSTKVALPYDTKIAYKFIVDGVWMVDRQKPTEMDGYNQNNVLRTSPAPPPPAPAPAPVAAPAPAPAVVPEVPKEEVTPVKETEFAAAPVEEPAPAPIKEEAPKPAVVEEEKKKQVQAQPAEKEKVFKIHPVMGPESALTTAVVPETVPVSTPPAVVEPTVPELAPVVPEAPKVVDIGDEPKRVATPPPPPPAKAAEVAPTTTTTVLPASIPLPATPVKQTPASESAPVTPNAQGTIKSSAISTHSSTSASSPSKKKSFFSGGLGSPSTANGGESSPVKSLKDSTRKKRNSIIGRIKRVFSDHHHKDKE